MTWATCSHWVRITRQEMGKWHILQGQGQALGAASGCMVGGTIYHLLWSKCVIMWRHWLFCVLVGLCHTNCKICTQLYDKKKKLTCHLNLHSSFFIILFPINTFCCPSNKRVHKVLEKWAFSCCCCCFVLFCGGFEPRLLWLRLT